MLSVQNTPVLDTSITKIETHTINPGNPNALKNNDIIQFSMNRSDSLILLEKSYFLISGRIAKKNADGTLAAPVATKFAQGGILHLFNRAELKINNQTIESVSEPGLTCIPRIYATYNEWAAKHLQVMGFGRDVDMMANGKFHNIVLPFKTLFSLGEDFKHVLVNVNLEILLTRARSDDNAIISSVAEDYVLELSSVQFKLPFVSVDDANRLKLLKMIDTDKPLTIAFRNWAHYHIPELPETKKHTWNIRTSPEHEKPRVAFVYFMTDRSGKPLKNANEYDHCNLRNIKLKLNNESFPYEDFDQNFDQNNYSVFYHMFCEFSAMYNGLVDVAPLVSLANFKTKTPIFIIDCSHQKESLKYGPIDVRLEFESNDAFPAKTSVNCILVHDTLFQYQPLSNVVRKYEG